MTLIITAKNWSKSSLIYFEQYIFVDLACIINVVSIKSSLVDDAVMV